jgi:hypothetical protein
LSYHEGGALLDGGDCLVDLERLRNRQTGPRAEPVIAQTVQIGVERSEYCYRRGNKTHDIKMRWGSFKGRRASLDVLNRLVDLERLGDRHTTLGAELVVLQAANEGW